MPTPRHGKVTRVLIDDQDLSAYFRELITNWDVDTPEATTFGVPNKVFLPGIDSGSIQLNGLFDGAAAAVDAKLSAVLGADPGPLALLGIEGAGIGRRLRLMIIDESAYNITNPVADVVSIAATFVPGGTLAAGIFLNDLSVPITTAYTGVGQDNGVLTNTGGIAQLHVVANSRTDIGQFKVQHSVDNSTWADLATFTNVPAATTAKERQVVASGTTINRYLRALITFGAGAGSVTFAIGFGRT